MQTQTTTNKAPDTRSPLCEIPSKLDMLRTAARERTDAFNTAYAANDRKPTTHTRNAMERARVAAAEAEAKVVGYEWGVRDACFAMGVPCPF